MTGGGAITTPASGKKNEERQASPDTVVETSGAAGIVDREWELSDFAGSPGFVAPEVVINESYDGRCIDAFSLGCVVLELTTGHSTFDHVWMNAYSHDTMA